MAQNQIEDQSVEENQPPGTFLLIHSMFRLLSYWTSLLLTPSPDETGESENHDRPQIILHPVPSRDPNEPLVVVLSPNSANTDH